MYPGAAPNDVFSDSSNDNDAYIARLAFNLSSMDSDGSDDSSLDSNSDSRGDPPSGENNVEANNTTRRAKKSEILDSATPFIRPPVILSSTTDNTENPSNSNNVHTRLSITSEHLLTGRAVPSIGELQGIESGRESPGPHDTDVDDLGDIDSWIARLARVSSVRGANINKRVSRS
jgi:hypothetical protein